MTLINTKTRGGVRDITLQELKQELGAAEVTPRVNEGGYQQDLPTRLITGTEQKTGGKSCIWKNSLGTVYL